MQELKVNLTPEGECVLRTGEAPRIFQYKGYAYDVESTDSFCRLLKAKAGSDADAAVVFVNEAGFQAIVDTRVQDRPQDKIAYDYQYSVLAQEWIEILERGRVFNIKQMIEFLKQREEGEIEDLDTLMYAAQNFKYVVKSEGDFTRDDKQNYVMAIKVGEAEGTVKVPEQILINVELYEGSGFTQCMEVEIDIHRPKSEQDGKPGFLLSCPKFDRYRHKAQKNEVNTLETALTDFLIVNGAPRTAEK